MPIAAPDYAQETVPPAAAARAHATEGQVTAPPVLGRPIKRARTRRGGPEPPARNATASRRCREKTREKRRRKRLQTATMLRALSPRRKFSFDLALHRSKEKKRKDSLDDAAFAAMVDETLGSSERPARSKSRVARAASFFRRGSSRERSDSKDYSSSARASRPSTRDTSARSSWLAMKEAREKQPPKKKMTYAERREAEKRAGKHRSAVGVQRGATTRRGSGICPGTRRPAWRNSLLHLDELSARSLDVHSRPRHLEGRGTTLIEEPCGRRPTRPRGNN